MSVPDMHGDGARPPSRGTRRFLKSKRTWGVLAAAVLLGTGIAVPAASFADSGTGCDFQQGSPPADACAGPLTGSTFAGGDGNLLASPTTFGTTDWENVAGLHKGIDLPSGSTDNAFGQGTKEDDPNVSVVTGSIPPQKSDLTRFYEASEFASNKNFLYLGWERTNVLGSANFDFEINQKTQPDLTTAGAKTLVRTAGDLLVTFDFTNGGGKPAIALLTWVTSGAASQCFSANKVPCWGNEKILGASTAVAAVNTDTVTDPISPNAPRSLQALTFGETAINLTDAGVFPSGTCEAFGSAFVRSRSSASFTAEIKDFIAPVPVNISNCGTVNIIKHTDPRGIDQNFSYTSTIPDPAAGSTTPDCTVDTTPSSFTLNDKNGVDPTPPITQGTANTEHCANVPAGSYTVTEGTLPANFTLESLTCTVDGTGGSTGSQDATNPNQANITVKPGDTVTCTYTNLQQLGAIKVTKASSKPAGTPLSGAKFTVTGPNNFSTTLTTGNDGTACVANLPFGTYTVTETQAPPGYDIDNSNGVSVPVDHNASCTSGTPNAPPTFTDTPLTDITATATSEVPGGTQSTITCTGTSTDNKTTLNSSDGPKESASVSATKLHPGTYTCTIVIDP
jgi:Prealbumin-like fold domain